MPVYLLPQFEEAVKKVITTTYHRTLILTPKCLSCQYDDNKVTKVLMCSSSALGRFFSFFNALHNYIYVETQYPKI